MNRKVGIAEKRLVVRVGGVIVGNAHPTIMFGL